MRFINKLKIYGLFGLFLMTIGACSDETGKDYEKVYGDSIQSLKELKDSINVFSPLKYNHKLQNIKELYDLNVDNLRIKFSDSEKKLEKLNSMVIDFTETSEYKEAVEALASKNMKTLEEINGKVWIKKRGDILMVSFSDEKISFPNYKKTFPYEIKSGNIVTKNNDTIYCELNEGLLTIQNGAGKTSEFQVATAQQKLYGYWYCSSNPKISFNLKPNGVINYPNAYKRSHGHYTFKNNELISKYEYDVSYNRYLVFTENLKYNPAKDSFTLYQSRNHLGGTFSYDYVITRSKKDGPKSLNILFQ